LHRLRSDAMTAMTEASTVARAAEHLELEITRSRSDSMAGGAHNHAHFQVRPASIFSWHHKPCRSFKFERLYAASWRLSRCARQAWSNARGRQLLCVLVGM
jgi:hypothetical protein